MFLMTHIYLHFFLYVSFSFVFRSTFHNFEQPSCSIKLLYTNDLNKEGKKVWERVQIFVLKFRRFFFLLLLALTHTRFTTELPHWIWNHNNLYALLDLLEVFFSAVFITLGAIAESLLLLQLNFSWMRAQAMTQTENKCTHEYIY